jgi:LysR family transcriptional regulator, hydrogen peroxide-inducible genes activator
MKISIQDLRYVLALAKTLHFGQAAKACFVTQPSLSNQLKNLEKRLDAKLFERSRKHVMITDFGQQFVTKAKDIIQRLEDLEKMQNDPFTGDLKMGIFPTLAPYLLPKIMPKLIQKFPALRFIVSEEKTATLIQKLKDGELDCILAAEPLSDTQFTHQHLFSDSFLLAVYPSHPLASKPQVTLQDLRHEPLLLLEEGHCMRDNALSVCALAGTPAHEDYRATSMETLRYMVAAKVGITLIPKIAIPRDSQTSAQSVIYIPFRDHHVQRNIGLYWRKSSGKTSVFEAIEQLLMSSFTGP